MSAQDNIERLFLLEILVDNVYISISDLDLDERTLSKLKQTCVKFQFLNYPPLEICEEDFAPSKSKYDADEVSFKSGKSCLFALRGQHPSAFSPPFNMNVTVYRIMSNKRPCTLGKTCIKLGDCFATIVNCCIVCPSSPTSKTIKDTFPLVNDRNCEIGNITVFIRLSCFGKYIVTQFQLGGLENKSFLFRADSENIKKEDESQKPKIMYPRQFKEAISKPETFCKQEETISTPTSHTKPPTVGPMMQLPSYPSVPPTFTRMGMQGMMPTPGIGSMMPFPGIGSMMPPHAMLPGFNTGQSMQLMPLTSNLGGGGEPSGIKLAPTSDYKELTASVNGHELCIRILRKPKKTKITKVLHSSDSDSSMRARRKLAEEKLKQAFCDCDEPFPKELLDIQCKRSEKRHIERKEPCPLLTGGVRGSKQITMSTPKRSSLPLTTKFTGQPETKSEKTVGVKENFVLKLGNCPPICYKVPPPHPIPPSPCVTDRDAQFEQQDMEKANKLYEDYLIEKAKTSASAGSEKGSAKAKEKGKKKGKGKKRKGKKK